MEALSSLRALNLECHLYAVKGLAMRVYSLTPFLLLAMLLPPKPRVRDLALTYERTATTITVRGCWTASGGPTGFITTATASGQPTQTHTLAVVNCDAFTFNAPAPAATITGNFQVIATKTGRSPSNPTTRAWSYTEPDVPLPPPVVDSIRVTPASATLLPGGSVQFTATVFGS